MRGASLTGFGKRPVATPAHQVDFPIGIGPLGAKISRSRTKPLALKIRLAVVDRSMVNFVSPLSEGSQIKSVRETFGDGPASPVIFAETPTQPHFGVSAL